MEWVLGLIIVAVIVLAMQMRSENGRLELETSRIASELNDIHMNYAPLTLMKESLSKDRYFLGFVNFYVDLSLLQCGLSPKTIDTRFLRSTVINLSGIPFEHQGNSKGVPASVRMNQLYQTNDPEFIQGSQDAISVIGLKYQRLKPEAMSDARVRQAFELATNEGVANSYGSVAKILMRICFIEYWRFGARTQID